MGAFKPPHPFRFAFEPPTLRRLIPQILKSPSVAIAVSSSWNKLPTALQDYLIYHTILP